MLITNEAHTHEEWQEIFKKQWDLRITFSFPDEFIIRCGLNHAVKIINCKGSINLICELCNISRIMCLEDYKNLLIEALKL